MNPPTASLDVGSAVWSDADLDLFGMPASQQPDWCDADALLGARHHLRATEPLALQTEVDELSALLAQVAMGNASILQAGDCAEDLADDVVETVNQKVAMLDGLASVMGIATRHPVLRVGRIAGQFAKPRSSPVERLGELDLPAFRGLMVNGPELHAYARRADANRMIGCHGHAVRTAGALRSTWSGRLPHERVWTSHEALILDYEIPLLRRGEDGRTFLASTHWPWIGDRTRQLGGAHIRLFSEISNPIACKVGPTMAEGELLALCEVLDPGRAPGRLTLISRFGSSQVHRVERLVRAVRDAGHPVVWLCDPMHGNTVKAPNGLKVRHLAEVIAEIEGFLAAVARADGIPGGLHLEATPDDIAECVGGGADPQPGPRYRSLCDPRLNLLQAVAAVAHWSTS